MAQAPSFRSRIAASAAALGLLLALGCSGKTHPLQSPGIATGTIQGTVTYVRIPLATDANGVPTGLDSNTADYKTLPARGVFVRAYELNSATSEWRNRQVTQTDSNGHYSMVVPAGDNWIIQVESFTQPFIGSAVSVIADPSGLSSVLPQAQRAHYILRSAPDGTAATPSTLLPAATVATSQTYTANFAVDLSTKWMIGSTELVNDLNDTSNLGAPQLTTAGFESSPTGSRVLAILDSIYAFSTTYGNPAPGAPVDLHYLMGHSEPEGTFIQYDRQHWLQPSGVDLAYDPLLLSDHYFGSIQGATANDDAWDESVLYVLLSRSNLIGQLAFANYATYPFTLKPVAATIDGLSPDLAMAEGLPYAMAANLLQSPYLADTDGSSGGAVLSVTDIRNISGVAAGDVGPYSPRTLAAMFWQIELKTNSPVTPPPDTPAEWATINPAALVRLFNIAAPTDPTTSQKLFIPTNIYTQLALLKNAKTPAEPVDLAAIFTDTAINAITQPFNLPWPQPSTTVFGQAWTSTTGGTYNYTGTLSMSADHQVNGAYPNASYLEIAYLGVSQVNDQTYNLTLQTTPSTLPAGATLQVVVFAGANTQAYTFSGNSTQPISFTLPGNGNTTTPLEYPIMVRLLSPGTLQPDIPFTLQLAPAPPGTLRGPVLRH